MAYQKQNFVDGLPLSAAQLNHIEEGIEELEKKIPEQGKPGSDGYTPVRGVDYWTDSDKETIIQEVITALGTPVFGTVDENNNIILTGELVDGTYTLKYEDEDGTLTEIGTLVHSSSDRAYTNQIPISKDTSGAVLNGTGYQAASRISTSSGTTADISNPDATYAVFTTGFIPVNNGDIVRLENCWMDTANLEDSASPYGHRTWALHVAFYDAMDTTIKKNVAWTDIPTSNLITPTIGDNGYITQFVVNVDHPYMRLNLAASDPSQAILTINETIA